MTLSSSQSAATESVLQFDWPARKNYACWGRASRSKSHIEIASKRSTKFRFLGTVRMCASPEFGSWHSFYVYLLHCFPLLLIHLISGLLTGLAVCLSLFKWSTTRVYLLSTLCFTQIAQQHSGVAKVGTGKIRNEVCLVKSVSQTHKRQNVQICSVLRTDRIFLSYYSSFQ